MLYGFVAGFRSAALHEDQGLVGLREHHARARLSASPALTLLC